MWILYAAGSSFFAGITAILAKCGIKKTDSDVATAIRTFVVLIFSRLVFGERLNRASLTGLIMIVAGTILLSVIS